MLAWFVDNTLAAAVLAGLVLVLCRLARFRPAAQHALWLVVLLKMLVPPGIDWPWSPWDLRADWTRAETTPAVAAGRLPEPGPAGGTASPTLGAELGPTGSLEGTQSIPSQGTEPLSTQPSTSLPLSPRPPEDPLYGTRPKPIATRSVSEAESPLLANASGYDWRPGWLAALWYLWAAGAAITLWMQIARGARFHRMVARGSTPPPWFVEELDRLAGRLGIRPPRSSVVPDLGCPVVWCLGRARLLWPAELIDRFDAERARGVLVHELAHLRRRDHWVMWLEMVAACVWWWNPLFWYVRRRLRHCAELACDAWVVWALPEGRRAYAESLIDVLQKSSTNTAVAPAWGAIGETRRYFERRLTMIYQARVRRRLSRVGLAAIGLLALAVLPGWSRPLAGQEAEVAAGETAGESPSGSPTKEEPKAEPRAPAAAHVPATEQVPSRYDPQPPQKTIEVFRLKHRDPGEMMVIATALFRLVAGKADRPEREVTVLAVVKAPGPSGGMYPGGDEGYGMPMGSGYPGSGYPGGMPPMPSAAPRELPELRLTGDPRTNALIARAGDEAMQIVRMLVAALDTPDDSLPAQFEKFLPDLRLLKLRHRTTEDMIRVLHQIGINVEVTQLPIRAGERVAGQDGVLIAAGDQADLDQIEQLIGALDVDSGKGGNVPGAAPAGGAPGVPGGYPAEAAPSRR